MASKLSEPSTAIVGYIRLNPPNVPSSTSVITNPAARISMNSAPMMMLKIGPMYGMLESSPASSGDGQLFIACDVNRRDARNGSAEDCPDRQKQNREEDEVQQVMAHQPDRA